MKTQDYTIEYLKALYPDLEYVDNILYLGEEVIQEDADLLIEEYYDGWEVTKAHSSGNPELETFEEVDGAEYIEYQFGGNYEEAFNFIRWSVKPTDAVGSVGCKRQTLTL